LLGAEGTKVFVDVLEEEGFEKEPELLDGRYELLGATAGAELEEEEGEKEPPFDGEL